MVSFNWTSVALPRLVLTASIFACLTSATGTFPHFVSPMFDSLGSCGCPKGCPKITEGHIREGFYHFEWARNWLGLRAHEHGSAGSFSLEARPEGDSIIAGKGWNPGLYDRNITYSGFYEVITSPDSGNSSASAISVYGWTRDLPVEYQIVESYSGGYSPGGDKKGTVTCNGASYDVFVGWRDNGSLFDNGPEKFQMSRRTVLKPVYTHLLPIPPAILLNPKPSADVPQWHYRF
ncbi:hypothetical protein PM082_023589 [Marasmius tenuissimus]|nr:hypothetical protein PM082_023589 [Marasmius tenuissimus]